MKWIECEDSPVVVNLAQVLSIEVVSTYGEYVVRANVGLDHWHNLYRGTEADCTQYLRDLVGDMKSAGMIL